MSSKNIGIVGSRRRNTKADYILVYNAFIDAYEPGDTIVSGGCKWGGDKFAEEIADLLQVPKIIHYPDKSKLDPEILKVNPKNAYRIINYARNILIAKDSDVLIACVAPDRKGGTEHTIRHFRRMKKKEPILV